jgi:outer membrane protein assembly factor BamB
VSEGEGGFSSVTVADGRAYLYVNWEYKVPIETRKLSKGGLKRLGWDEKMPEELQGEVEKARLSEERAGLDRKKVRAWVNEWMKENLSKDERRWRGIVQRRLIRGKDAIPLETLRKFNEIADHQFATEKELDAWLDEHQIPAEIRKRVKKVIPTTVTNAHDVIMCFDAENGKTLWKNQYDGRAYGWPSSSTVCVEDGRAFVLGSNAMVYCLDAATGDVVWKTKSKANAGTNASSSFVVVDDKAIVMGGPLMAFDVKSGEMVWSQNDVKAVHNSPVLWNSRETTRIVCHTGRNLACVDPEDGKVLWSVDGGKGNSSPVIHGDYMAVVGQDKNFGLRAYRLAAEKPEQLWSVEFQDRGTSPLIYQDHVYAFGGRNKAKALCVELETGDVKWEEKIPNTEFSSPVGSDGKILAVVGRQLFLVQADPDQFRILARANLGVTRCVSPTLVDGRVYLRLVHNVAAYDLHGE